MHVSLLADIVCPACRQELTPRVHEQRGDHLHAGLLSCAACGLRIPVLEGMAFFTEPLAPDANDDAAALQQLAQRLFGSADDFGHYHAQRWQRGSLEAYAAFHPFNESTRSLEPLLPHVQPLLRAADLVLDVWCRTGWSGEWLAGRFPGQRVLSFWEGNSSVMGYRGFRYLLQERAANLDVFFVHPGHPWPLRDQSVALLHAADCLHRYPWPHIGDESLRVTRHDGAALFPHVHLSNSEPVPFFERGGRHAHGRDYRDWLQGTGASRHAEGWVLSEAALFTGPDTALLADDSETSHYNGVLALLPRQRPAPVPPSRPALETQRFVLSPLFRFSLARAQWRLGPTLHAGAVGHLLQRHPVYEQRLPAAAVDCSDAALVACLLALLGQTGGEIASAFEPALPAGLPALLESLLSHDILRPAQITKAGQQLQCFHANQLPPPGAVSLQAFWSAVAKVESPVFNAGGQGLSGADLDGLARLFWPLMAQRCREGWLSLHGRHPLLLWLALVASSCGLCVRLQAAAADVHPDCGLHVAEQEPAVPGLWLGLPEQDLPAHAEALLPLLAEAPAVAVLPVREGGLLQVPLAEGYALLSPAQCLQACAALRQQQESRFFSLSGESVLRDLLMLVTALQQGATPP